MRIQHTFLFILIVFLGLGLTACGADAPASGTSAEASPAPEPAAETAAPASSTTAEGVRRVVLQPVGDEMKFATTSFSVAPGQTVTLVFENTATSPAMQHNVVVLDAVDAINRVGQAAITAGEAKAYVPDDASILAYTPLAKPGETVEVTFTAPATPGDYPFICTFPGHYMMMQGTMRVGG